MKFLYLGQIEEHKGILLLLKVFSKFADHSLIIAGAGSLLKKLQSENKNSQIHFIGPYSDPYKLLQEADCLVIPSICYENLPTVALEAIRAKTPVIGSRLGGIGEVIGNDKLLFEPTEEDLKNKLEWIIANSDDLKKQAAIGRSQIQIPSVAEYLEAVIKYKD